MDLEVHPKDRDNNSSDQRHLMRHRDKLDDNNDYDGSFDSYDTVSASCCDVVVSIADDLLVLCMSSSMLLPSALLYRSACKHMSTM